MSLHRDSWSEFGLVNIRWWKDTLAVIGIMFCDYLLYYVTVFTLDHLFGPEFVDSSLLSLRQWRFPTPDGPVEKVMLVAFCMANGFSEEITMRGYLLPRLERLLGSTSKALLLTSAMFASYHVYLGLGGILSSFMFGIVYGAYFCWQRRLWPLATAHTLCDLLIFLGLYP
jgi:membrane protease YdiL (CAAX protease family)